MKITDLKHYQPKERPAQHPIPTTPEREPDAPVTIIGGVTEVRGSLFMLNDDPVGNWFRAGNEIELEKVTTALRDNLTLRVTVEGKVVRKIEL